MTQPTVWKKSGDYNDVKAKFLLGGRTEQVIYTHCAPHKCINLKEIKLFSEHQNELILELEIGSGSQQVKDYLSRNGYPTKGGTRTLNGFYYIQIPNAQFLADFLNVLKDIDPDVNLIANEMVSSIREYVHQPTIAGWIQDGSFENHPNVAYLNVNHDANITSVTLEDNGKPGKLRLYVDVKKTAHQQIVNILKNQGFKVENLFGDLLSCEISSKNLLETALNALTLIEPSIANVRCSLIADSNIKLKYEAPRFSISMFTVWVGEPRQPQLAGEEPAAKMRHCK